MISHKIFTGFLAQGTFFFIILIPDFFIDFIWGLYKSKKLVTYWQCVKYVLNTPKKDRGTIKVRAGD